MNGRAYSYLQTILKQPYREEYNRAFNEYLIEQIRTLHRPVGFIAMVAWINFAFRIDPLLHPEFPGLFYFRMGLTISGAYVFVASFFEPLRGKGMGLFYVLAVFSLLSCSFFTGRLADDAGYVAGIQILILIFILGPCPYRVLVTFYILSIMLFVSAVLIYKPDISSPATQYSLNNLVITYLLGFVGGFFLDRMRFNVFLNQARLNNALDELQQLINNVAEKSAIVTTSSTSLLSLSDKMADSTRKMVLKMEEISSAVTTAITRMNSSMNTVTEYMKKSSKYMSVAETAAENISSSMRQINENSRQVSGSINKVVPLVARASGSVRELGQAAGTISNVSQAISDISGQTNLLSLNATIEAARAGDAGKGFAVVAAEVKQLASQAGQATKDIKQQIERIELTTSATMAVIDKFSNDITQINEIVSSTTSGIDNQQDAVNRIFENVSKAAGGIQDAASNIAGTTAVSSDVTGRIADLESISHEMMDITSQVNASVQELSDLADQLNNTLEGIRSRQ